MFDDKGFFNGLFDFNNDGKLDAFERAADFAAFQELVSDNEETDTSDFEQDTFTDESDEILASDLDYDELEYMDEDERNDLLEEMGLDPEDYDF
jgi:hypothetical protein